MWLLLPPGHIESPTEMKEDIIYILMLHHFSIRAEQDWTTTGHSYRAYRGTEERWEQKHSRWFRCVRCLVVRHKFENPSAMLRHGSTHRQCPGLYTTCPPYETEQWMARSNNSPVGRPSSIQCNATQKQGDSVKEECHSHINNQRHNLWAPMASSRRHSGRGRQR